MVGSEAVALAHVLRHGGSGDFPESDVASRIDSGELSVVEDAPVFQRRSYLVYRKDAAVQDSIDIAIRGLREVLAPGSVGDR